MNTTLLYISLVLIVAGIGGVALGLWANIRAAAQPEDSQPDPVDSHFEQAQTASGADEAVLRALAGASFGPKACLVLPSGRRLTGDEAQALAAFYAPAAERSTR